MNSGIVNISGGADREPPTGVKSQGLVADLTLDREMLQDVIKRKL